MDTLTQRQKSVLEFVSQRIHSHGAPPTLREIAGHIGTKGTVTALRHLEALEKKGFLKRQVGASRGIFLTEKSGRTEALVLVPLVGSVWAGPPHPAIENFERHIGVSPEWVKGAGCFFLRVKGDSMVDAHILDGDLALIRPQVMAQNGDIVVAVIDGEATLKRFFHEGTQIRLQPENRNMPPIVIHENDAEAVILGKLLKTIRSFE